MNSTQLATPEDIAVRKLTTDQRKAAAEMQENEARYLVDQYYQIQEFRKAAANQGRSQKDAGEPFVFHGWYTDQLVVLENSIKAALDKFSANHPLGAAVREVTGIGPVIAAGLIAHIDIDKAPTAGHIWSFAGLNPTAKWEKGQKRPWNADLKVLCYKIGESFVKVQNNPNDEYGHLFRAYKDELIKKNEEGAFKEAAEHKLATTKIGKDTEAYKWYSEGKLPPAHIHARARRWVVKLFLSDYHTAACRILKKQEPPVPYVLEHVPGHAHWRIGEWVPTLPSTTD
jgi:hypothetical protein